MPLPTPPPEHDPIHTVRPETAEIALGATDTTRAAAPQAEHAASGWVLLVALRSWRTWLFSLVIGGLLVAVCMLEMVPAGYIVGALLVAQAFGTILFLALRAAARGHSPCRRAWLAAGTSALVAACIVGPPALARFVTLPLDTVLTIEGRGGHTIAATQDDVAVLACRNCQDNLTSLLLVSLTTGEVIAEPDPIAPWRGYSSISAVGEELFIIHDSRQLSAFSAEGKALWNFTPWNPSDYPPELLSFDAGGTVVVKAGTGNFASEQWTLPDNISAIAPDGTVAWTREDLSAFLDFPELPAGHRFTDPSRTTPVLTKSDVGDARVTTVRLVNTLEGKDVDLGVNLPEGTSELLTVDDGYLAINVTGDGTQTTVTTYDAQAQQDRQVVLPGAFKVHSFFPSVVYLRQIESRSADVTAYDTASGVFTPVDLPDTDSSSVTLDELVITAQDDDALGTTQGFDPRTGELAWTHTNSQTTTQNVATTRLGEHVFIQYTTTTGRLNPFRGQQGDPVLGDYWMDVVNARTGALVDSTRTGPRELTLTETRDGRIFGTQVTDQENGMTTSRIVDVTPRQ